MQQDSTFSVVALYQSPSSPVSLLVHFIINTRSFVREMAPILLPANQPPERFYRGGSQIAHFRSTKTSATHEPEDWIASTTCCHGCASSRIGMTVLPDGRLFADLIKAEAEYWLGPEHCQAFGADTKLLVKLLDAGQRLPVHAHPHVNWAREHVGAAHGKAEAWFLLTSGEIYLGLQEDISSDELLDLVRRQDVNLLLSKMHRLEVHAYQTVYVPPGTLHAIGQGLLLVEVQEPEDLSILCEWEGFEIDGLKDGHLGLGFPKALSAVNTRGCTREDITKLVTSESVFGSVVSEQSSAYFVLERIEVDGSKYYRRGFAILIVSNGTADLLMAGKDPIALSKGNTVVIPHGDGDFALRGKGEVIIARPPQPV